MSDTNMSIRNLIKRMKDYESDSNKFDVAKAYKSCPPDVKKILDWYGFPEEDVFERDSLRQLSTNLKAHGYEVEWNDMGFVTYLGKKRK